MHFSKTYTQLLQSLPPDLRENAIEYRQLKKIINQIVSELEALGLQPAVLHALMGDTEAEAVEAETPAAVAEGGGERSITEGEEEGVRSVQGPAVVGDGDGDSVTLLPSLVASTSALTLDPAQDLTASLTASSSSSSGAPLGLDSVAAALTQVLASTPVPDASEGKGKGKEIEAEAHGVQEGKAGSSTSAFSFSSSLDASAGAGGPSTSSTSTSTSAASVSTSSTSTSRPIHASHPRVVYELNAASGKIEPQLRIWIGVGAPHAHAQGQPVEEARVEETEGRQNKGKEKEKEKDPAEDDGVEGLEELEERTHDDGDGGDNSDHARLLWEFQQRHFEGERIVVVEHGDASREIVIPLVHDTHFFTLLSSKLSLISAHLDAIHTSFTSSLSELQRMIADASAPASAAPSHTRFRPSSRVASDAGGVRVRTREGDLQSDLYFWREIFEMYVEAEVFESVAEADRGERSVQESERRLQMFAERATKRGMGAVGRLKLQASREALERFLRMNLMILDVKKFSHANSEATRKILKKHTKRTALFYPGLSSSSLLPSPTSTPTSSSLTLPPPTFSSSSPFTLPRLLVQALCTTLLPIIPSLEDYSCLICTSIAFKPIRLDCGHLFCVRCLVKMQKRGKGECPCCRRWVVLGANRRNVDWALLNFMQDWFPIEARDKLRHNEKEAAEEEMRELGIDPDVGCVVG